MPRSQAKDLAVWEEHRPHLLGLAYRMLGDYGRAEDLVQEAWVRWSGRGDEAKDPRAYLVALVTRLCLNELQSARARKEESRSDRLPEPVAIDPEGPLRLESLEQVSMAFLVLLQRLSPAERAVLLLHDVLELGHGEISTLVGKTVPACRKLLERARAAVRREKRLFRTTREEHARMLEAFVRAATEGDADQLVGLLAKDAVLVGDAGTSGRRVAGVARLGAPLRGNRKVAAFLASTATRVGRARAYEVRELNGQPALVLLGDDGPFAAMLLGVADGRVHRIWFQADSRRLSRVDSP